LQFGAKSGQEFLAAGAEFGKFFWLTMGVIVGQECAADDGCMAETAEGLNDEGSGLLAAGRVVEAVSALRRAVQLRPDAEVLHFNLGNALKAGGQRDEARACYRRAIELKPGFVAALCNLAAMLQEDEQLQEALLTCQTILACDPNNTHCYTILGNVFNSMDRLDDAANCYRQALAIQPELIEAWTSLAAVLVEQEKLDEAIACCHRSLELKPDSAVAINNLGTALEQKGQLQDAFGCFCKAVELDPAFTDAHLNRSNLLLVTGDFERGWPEYEWRWKTKQMRAFEHAAPKWEGEPLLGRTILLQAEQGLGDTIQFIRYAPLVKRLRATVVVECQKPLVKLLSSCQGIDQWVARGDDLPPFDLHAPLLSLPRILKTTLESIPAEVPYLSADPRLVEEWQKKLSGVVGFRIGVNWHGRTGQGGHLRRDVPPDLFAALAQLPGVRLISLQKGATTEELAAVGGGQAVFEPGEDFDRTNGAFMDTAAIMKNVDLVITSDTSVPHLAGALGVPVWVLLPLLPDWRWLLNRSDSPWYPTMRLFRQVGHGDWGSVLQQVQAALVSHLRDQNWKVRFPSPGQAEPKC
jgi:tetratricopeptide (TPR) repeat protein